MTEKVPKIIIVGSGFAGVDAARELEKIRKNVSILIISDRKWHDYKARLFKIIEENNTLSTRIPLKTLINKAKIKTDKIETVDLNKQLLIGKSGEKYLYDYLVISTGSISNYHGVKIIKDLTYTINSSNEALRLQKHIENTLQSMLEANLEEKISLGHFVVIGGGGTGVEMAAAISIKARRYAKHINLDSSFITIDLFHSGSRLLNKLRPELSKAAEMRLRSLGVNIFFNRRITKEHIENISIGDIHIKANTIIWTAGVKQNKITLYQKDSIDDHLRLLNHPMVYIVGDAGFDPHYGMAQTALRQARYVSKEIEAALYGKGSKSYTSSPVYYAIPIGSYWAAVQMKYFNLIGFSGWIIRRLIDLRYLVRRMPLHIALKIFTGAPKRVNEKKLGESSHD